MSDPKLKPVTMSMIWTYLLFTVHQYAKTSPAVERAWNRVGERYEGSAVFAENEIEEEMTREHFPSGMVDGTGWQHYASGKPEAFWDVFQSPYDDEDEEENCPRLFSEVCESIRAPLSPTNPAHVAMVARALALSFAMPCGVEPVAIEVDARLSNDPETDETIEGVRVQIRDLRRSGQLNRWPISAGRFFPNESVDSADVGTLLFRWFLDRHTEIASVLNPPGQATT